MRRRARILFIYGEGGASTFSIFDRSFFPLQRLSFTHYARPPVFDLTSDGQAVPLTHTAHRSSAAAVRPWPAVRGRPERKKRFAHIVRRQNGRVLFSVMSASPRETDWALIVLFG